jgi:hypothetical protein
VSVPVADSESALATVKLRADGLSIQGLAGEEERSRELAGSSPNPILQTKSRRQTRRRRRRQWRRCRPLYLRGRRRRPQICHRGWRLQRRQCPTVGAVASAPDDAMVRPWRIARRTARVSTISCDEPTAPGVSMGSGFLRPVRRRYRALQQAARACRAY